MNEHRQSPFPMKNKDNCNNNNVSALDIEKTSQGIHTVNHLTNFFIVGVSALNGF